MYQYTLELIKEQINKNLENNKKLENLKKDKNILNVIRKQKLNKLK